MSSRTNSVSAPVTLACSSACWHRTVFSSRTHSKNMSPQFSFPTRIQALPVYLLIVITPITSIFPSLKTASFFGLWHHSDCTFIIIIIWFNSSKFSGRFTLSKQFCCSSECYIAHHIFLVWRAHYAPVVPDTLGSPLPEGSKPFFLCLFFPSLLLCIFRKYYIWFHLLVKLRLKIFPVTSSLITSMWSPNCSFFSWRF